MSEELSPEARARLLRDLRAEDEGPAESSGLLHERYEVVRELGRGGMGVVYEARDVALRRRVAVKVLRLPGPGIAEQVLREARAAARLDHPGIAAVHDAYDDAIVMQFVDGRPLSDVAAPDARTLAAWIRDAARAVHHAHEQGIVHRDLKPHNLMVDGERVVVTDFGLAKELAVESSLSLSGSVLGTPAYMPPEQAGGRAREVDARSDVYALGATLYDRLAGRPPFVERDVVRLLRAVVEDEPAPLARVAPRVPRDLALVVHRCLEKDKERRYASADELADDLERWLAGDSVRARPPSLAYRARKLAWRRRGLLSALGAVLVVALALGAWSWSERSGRRATEEATALVDDVERLWANARTLDRQDADYAEERARLLDEGIERCRAFLARHDAFRVRARLGRLLRARGRQEEALEAFEATLERAPDYAPARLERGLLLYDRLAEAERRGDADAATLRARVLADLEVVEDPDTELSVLERLQGEARLAALRGQRDAERRLWEELQRLDPGSIPARLALAPILLDEGDRDEALRQAFGALDLARGFAPPAPQEEVDDTSEPEEPGEPRRAEETLEIPGLEGRFVDHAARNAESSTTAGAYAVRAQGQARRAGRALLEDKPVVAIGALTIARDDLASALTIAPHLYGLHGDRGLVGLALARACRQRERFPEAEDALAEAVRDLAAEMSVYPTAAAVLNHALGARAAAEAALERGAPAEAEAILRAALPSLASALERAPTDAGLLLARARILALLSRWSADAQSSAEALDRALVDFDHAIALAPWDARPRGWRGVARIEAGDVAGGRADLEQALYLGPEADLRATFEGVLREHGAEVDESR